MYHFNDHITKTLLNEYAGSEKKMTVLMDDGNKYLLKFPDPTREKGLVLSYINNAVSEYISCHIFSSVGIPVQETTLGEYVDRHGKTRIACACKDVRENGERMFEINKLELSSLDNTNTKDLSLEYMEEVFQRMSGLIPEDQLRDFYYNMFIVDALTGNTDRHNGNWAILESDTGVRISPVYDCGSSLAPLVDERLMCEDSGARCAMNALSVLNDSEGKRIRYCNFFEGSISESMKNALKRMVPRINLDKIRQIVADTPYISPERKGFYRSFLSTSYERILLPALDKSLQHPDKIPEFSHEECKNFYRNAILPMKQDADYSIRKLTGDIQYSKAGKSRLILYQDKQPVCVLSVHSSDRDTRTNMSKCLGLGIDPKSLVYNRKTDLLHEQATPPTASSHEWNGPER